MSIVFDGAHSIGTGFSKTSGTTLVSPGNTALVANTLMVVVVAADNITTTDGNTNDHTACSLTTFGALTKAREFTNGQAAAAGGATVSIWYGLLTGALGSGGQFTVTFASAITAKALTGFLFSVGAGSTIGVAGGVDLANDAADAGSMTINPGVSREYAFVRGLAIEADTPTYTASTNMTAATANGTTGGSAVTNMAARAEYRIVTATSQVTDPTTGAFDQASTGVAFYEIVPVTSRGKANTQVFGRSQTTEASLN